MKKFVYPDIQIATASQVPDSATAVMEWRSQSEHALINVNRLRRHIE